MPSYICFYKGKKHEVVAETSYQAQKIIAERLKVKRAYDITVVLVELDGKPVVHNPVD